MPTEAERMAERARKKEAKEERKRLRNGGKIVEVVKPTEPVVLTKEQKMARAVKRGPPEALLKLFEERGRPWVYRTEKAPEKETNVV